MTAVIATKTTPSARRQASPTILAIDPGPVQSALCWYVDEFVFHARTLPNSEALAAVRERQGRADLLAVEMVASYGMAVGAEVFETCVWIGRFVEAWGGDYCLIKRLECKLHLCHDSRAKDSNVRQALIDRFGGPDALRRPQKCKPCRGAGAVLEKPRPLLTCEGCGGRGVSKPGGRLAGVTGDQWAALAVAVTAVETDVCQYCGRRGVMVVWAEDGDVMCAECDRKARGGNERE